MKVAVIGAGVSGLAALKSLKEEGISAVAFDQRDAIGGLWNLEGNCDTPAYPGLSMNTSRQVSSFSDFPYPPSDRFYPAREEALTYLKSYAQKNSLFEQVELGVEVKRIRMMPDLRWELTAISSHGRIQDYFDAVIVCTGRHLYPNLPSFPNIESFSGEVIHSMKYSDAAPFQDRRILIVGSGASAADLAFQLSKVGRKVYVSVKEGRWIIPRLIRGRPVDHRLTRFSQWLPRSLGMLFFRHAILREFDVLGIKDGGYSIGLPTPPFDLRKIRLTLNTDFLLAVKEGVVSIKPEIRKFDGDYVYFTDQTKETIDVLISATGYKIEFPFFNAAKIVSDHNDLNLYRYIFPPNYPNLSFVGLVNVQGPFLPVYEIQTRWISRVLSGQIRLPSKETMYDEIKRRQRYLLESKKRPAIVQYYTYMEEIAAQIGVRPRILRNPKLLYALLFRPISGVQYRINGLHSWDGAADALVNPPK